MLALMFIGGGYLLWVNKMPPFNRGGIFDGLGDLLPKKEDGSSILGGDEEGGDDEAAPAPLGIPPGPVPPSITGAPPPLGNPNLPPTMGGMPPSPQQPPSLGAGVMPLPPFQTSLQSDPSKTDWSVYNNYATALQWTYGAGNQANLGPGGAGQGPVVVGDPNLGTTPVPNSIFQPPTGISPYGGMPNGMGGPMPPGMGALPAAYNQPGYAPGYPPNMGGGAYGGQLPFSMGGGAMGPSTPPSMPFLPNPTQMPMGGGIQQSPYPGSPPPVQYPVGVPAAVGVTPVVFTPGGISYKRRHDGYMPILHGIEDLYKVDIGKVMGGDFPPIRIGDLVNMGYPLRAIFPNGVDYNQDEHTQDDIERWVERMYSRMGTRSAQSLFSLMKSPMIMQFI